MLTVKQLMEILNGYSPDAVVLATWESIYTELFPETIAISKNGVVVIFADQDKAHPDDVAGMKVRDVLEVRSHNFGGED